MDNSQIDWSNPDANRTYSPEELGIGASPSTTPPAPKPIDWHNPDPNRTYSADELGMGQPAPPTKQPTAEDAAYEQRVQKYMPEARKVLAPKSSLDYIPGVKQGFAALEAGVGAGEGDTFSERYQNMMAKQDAYRRAKEQDEEQRIQTQMPKAQQQYANESTLGRMGEAAAHGFFNMPVVGPLAQKTAAGLAAGMQGSDQGATFDERYLNNLAKVQAAQRLYAQENPISTVAGSLAQAPLLPGGSAKTLGEVAATGAGYGLADAASTGENPYISGAIGAGGGALGHGTTKGIEGTIGGIGSGINAAKRFINPTNVERAETAAEKEFGKTYADELQRAPKDASGNIIDPTFISPEMMAKQNAAGQNVMGLDVGASELIRKARALGVQNPNFDSQMRSELMQRFGEQQQDTKEMFKNLYGQDMDPVELMNQAKESARQANGPNYKAVFGVPEAQDVWNPRLKELMQTPEIQNAIGPAKSKFAWSYIKAGLPPPPTPLFDETGNPTTKIPLEFWDSLKRSLGDQAYAPGAPRELKEMTQEVKNALGPQYLGDLGQQYHDTLDTASKFFGEGDAFSMGQKLINPMKPDKRMEALNKLNKLTSEERDHAEKGLVSGAMDQIMNSKNPASTTKMLDSPNTRQMFQKLVDPQKLDQIEGALRVQNIMNKAKNTILSQSPTAPSLVDTMKNMLQTPTGIAKIAGTGGMLGEAYNYFTGDEADIRGHLRSSAIAAVTGLMAQRYGKFNTAKAQAMQRILLSNDPDRINKAVNSIVGEKNGIEFLRKMDRMTSRSAGSMNQFVRNSLAPSPDQDQERPQRKSGGRSTKNVPPQPGEIDFFARVLSSMRAHKKSTKHALSKHDNDVATSLEHAQQQVTNADPVHN